MSRTAFIVTRKADQTHTTLASWSEQSAGEDDFYTSVCFPTASIHRTLKNKTFICLL